MRNVPYDIDVARYEPLTQLATIWRLERTDGVVLRFTDHDRDLTIDGETFVSSASFDPSALKGVGDMSVSDLEVIGAFDSAAITQADVLAGRYLGASFWVAEVLWSNPEAGKDIKKAGWLGRVREVGGKFVAELHGLEAQLQHPILRVHTPGCNAVLGDARCTVNVATFTQSGTVTESFDRHSFTVSGVTNTGDDVSWFEFGKVTFTSGLNDGLSMEIRGMNPYGFVTLWSDMPFTIEAGDTVDVVAGCSGSLAACRFKFDNVLNFRGKPHVPVSDDIIKGPVRGTFAETDTGITAPVDPAQLP